MKFDTKTDIPLKSQKAILENNISRLKHERFNAEIESHVLTRMDDQRAEQANDNLVKVEKQIKYYNEILDDIEQALDNSDEITDEQRQSE